MSPASGIMTAKTLITLSWKQPPAGIWPSFQGMGESDQMKHALIPFALALMMMAGFVASATGSMERQSKSPSTSPSTAVAIYGSRCASCHGKDGKSDTFKGKLRSARDLSDPKWQADVSDERIFNSITNGKGRMPAFGKKLSEAETNSLVSYVRGFKK